MFLLSQLRCGDALSVHNAGGTLGEEACPLQGFAHGISPEAGSVAHGGQQCPVASNFPQVALSNCVVECHRGVTSLCMAALKNPLPACSKVLRQNSSSWTASPSMCRIPASSIDMAPQWLLAQTSVNHCHILSFKEAWNSSLGRERLCLFPGCYISALGSGLHQIPAILQFFGIFLNSHQFPLS